MRYTKPEDIFEPDYLSRPEYVAKKLRLAHAIDLIVTEHATNTTTWLDLGSQQGRFGVINLVKTQHHYQNRIAVEIDREYWSRDTRAEWVRLNMSAEEYVHKARPHDGVTTLLDVIEHLPKPNALQLLESVEAVSELVILFTPSGFDAAQNEYPFTDEHPTEKHLSGFTSEELTALGYHVDVLHDFHADKRADPRHAHAENLDALLAYKVCFKNAS